MKLEITHTPISQSFKKIMEASVTLPRLDEAQNADIIGIQTDAQLNSNREISLSDPTFIVQDTTFPQNIPLSGISNTIPPQNIRLYALLMEWDKHLPEHISKPAWNESTNYDGYDLRTLYIFHRTLVILDNVHDEDEEDTFLSRSAVFLLDEEISAHQKIILKPHLGKVETFIQNNLPPLLSDTPLTLL